MDTINILLRNIKWRFQNPVSIFLTIVQPLIWLVLYSTIANQTMQKIEKVNYTAFVLPGIMMLVTLSCSSSGGYLNFIMKSQGSFYRIIIAPVKRSSLVLGQILESVFLSCFEISILILVSLFLSVRISSGFTGLLVMIPLIFLTTFFMSGLTYTISLCLPNEVIYETLMNLLVLTLFFTSTALFPMKSISGIFKLAVMLNPFTYIVNVLRDLIFSSAIDWNNVFSALGLFTMLSLVSFIVAVKKLCNEYQC